MSETVLLSDILLRDYVKNYVKEMNSLGKTKREISDSLVEILYGVAKEEDCLDVFLAFSKSLFSDWVSHQIYEQNVQETV